MRYREAGRNRSRVVGTKADAKLFDAEITRHKRMGDLSTLDSGNPGAPLSRSNLARSVPSTQSITMTYWSPSKKSSRTSGSEE